MIMSKVYTIKDSNGRYVNSDSVTYDRSKKKYDYKSYDNYLVPVCFYCSKSRVKEIINKISKRREKANLGKMTFNIVEIEDERIGLFAILDSDSRYVDKNSIWYEKETGEWHYSTYDTYYAPCWLHRTKEDAMGVIEGLMTNLDKVNLIGITFSIEEVVC